MARFLVAALCLGFLGCAGKLSAPPEIGSESQAGAHQLVFLMSAHHVHADGSQTFSAQGLLQGRPVGFDVLLGPWRENPPGYVNMATWESRARLVSRGSASDELLKYLDQTYAALLSPTAMAESVECQALALWNDPRLAPDEPMKLNLLFSGGFDEAGDAEVWLEIRPEQAKVYWREKDARFRRALIRALAGPTEE